MNKNSSAWLKVLLFVAYITLVIFVSSRHEPWRDEFADLSIAMESRTLGDLFHNSKTEGFPILWYFVLWIGFKIFPQVVVLKIVNLILVSLAVGIFLCWAPFPWWQQALWIFGFFPAYQYSVINRSYGLSMLLLFVICALYPKRWQKIIPFAAAVFLFANTNVHSLILSLALVFSLGWEVWKEGSRLLSDRKIVAGFGVMLLGIFLSVLQVFPDPDSIVKIYNLTPSFIFQQLPQAFIPGPLFAQGFALKNVWILSALIGIFYLANFSKTSLGLFSLSGGLGLSWFFLLFYPGMPRHQGFLYLLITAVLWMEKDSLAQIPAKLSRFSSFFKGLRGIRNWIFVFFLFLQIGAAYDWIAKDIRQPFTANVLLADYIRQRPEYQDAILIPEPDYLLISVGYYLPNKIFLPRQHQFATRVQYAKTNDAFLSMTQLLEEAARFKKETQKPVLIIFGHRMSENEAEIRFSYHKVFRCTQAERIEFFKNTRKRAIFDEGILGDERYEVYEFLPSDLK